MKRNINKSLDIMLKALGFAALLNFPLIAHSATVALSNAPLASTTTTPVKPNVYFILDDSGSMDRNYLPDWGINNNPLSSPNIGAGSRYTDTKLFHRNAGFNGVAYNPATTYLKPVHFNANGTLNTTTYPDQLSPWTAVKYDGYGIQTPGDNSSDLSDTYPDTTPTTNLVGNASYFTWVFAEYCSTLRMTSCVTSSAPITIGGIFYDVPAKLRWCDSKKLDKCQSINDATYKFPRYPGAFIAKTGASATITINSKGTVSGIKVNSEQIMSGSKSSTSITTLASRVRDAINACTAATSSNCTIAGYSATVSGNIITITAPASLGAITFTPALTTSGGASGTATAFSGYTEEGYVPGTTHEVTIASTSTIKTTVYTTSGGTTTSTTTTTLPYPGSATKAATRSDCAGTTCTYTEEMNNYANWWAYYHTRMQAMKTSVSRAFKNINKNFRVGFSTISETGTVNNTKFLGNDTFELAHKQSWFDKLFKTNPNSSTPLRGALSKAGRYYGGKFYSATNSPDPVQYSCQQNFSILSTDGYWNTNDESSTYKALDLAGNLVGNHDKGPDTPRPMREGTTEVSNTLADVAKYYYDTDLRTTDLGNCPGGKSTDFPSGNTDVCENNVFISAADNNTQQHMTTFTMGLGIDGTLVYQGDYDTATSGDFYNLKKGLGSPTANWPDPITNDEGERIDDLWHAAVNGRGYYFSAKDPDEIINGLSRTLSAITAKLGAAAAAATSTLNPVPGNNFSYVASYTTVTWTGNLESRSVNTVTGQVSKTANWCVENVTASSCVAPNTIAVDNSGSSTVYNCVAPNSTLAECPAPGVFDAVAETCSTQIANACTGTLPGRVAPYADTRNIVTANDAGDGLVQFDASYATDPDHVGYFNAARISTMNQWGTLTATQRTAAEGVNLLNYLRGQNGYEDRLSNPATDRLYRAREATMGDALESQPAFVGNPIFPYVYPGYENFRTTYANRAGVVYMGTNDGMVHAFDATTGQENWAYIPSMVIPNMWKLADNVYSTSHVNYVNGSVNTSDICVANCDSSGSAVWKTILVGGLSGGGRGYYALDITDPTTPALLWEFTTTAGIGKIKDDELGYSFGNPIVTRTPEGQWVVLVTSGYNNVSPGDGKGYLFVLDAYTGAILKKISTGAGSTTTPSGLAKIAVWNEESGGNKTGHIYGGDLLGNVWRFDINDTATTAVIGTGSVMKFATLFSDALGTNPQPVTTAPILGDVNGNRVVFIGTGKYLEAADLSNTQTQTIYAIKDDPVTNTSTFINPRDPAHTGVDRMVQQVLTNNPDGTATRLVTDNKISFDSDRGWFVDFPDASSGNGAKERVNIEGKLVGGTLIIPTIVPSNTVCRPGGYGWLNFFNYETGSKIKTGIASVKYDSPIVGINIIFIQGKAIVEVVTAADPTPEVNDDVEFFGDGSGFTGQRVIWREVIQ